jgi:hypothetical protein
VIEDQDRVEPGAAAAVPAAPPAPLWEDFLDIFYTPSSVFDRRRAGKWGTALFVFYLLILAVTFVVTPLLQPYTEAALQRAMGSMAAQQGDSMMATEMPVGWSNAAQTFTLIFQPIMTAVGAILIGLLLALASRIFGAGISAAQGVMIGTYASFPKVLQMLAMGAHTLIAKPEGTPDMSDLSFGPLRFIGTEETSLQMQALLGRFDLFTIWVVVLQIIGIKVVARTSWGKAAMAAGSIWLIFTLASFAMPRGT